MNDNYILLYGGLSGCFSEIVGNLSNIWKYTGHYHSANPFLCSSGFFHDWDQKKNFIRNNFLNEYKFKRLIKQLFHDVKWNALAWCLRLYIKERSYRNIIKEDSNVNQPLSLFLHSFVFGSAAQLCCSSLFSIRHFLKSKSFFSFQQVSIRVIQFGTLFGTYDMLKSIMKKKDQKKMLIAQTYFIAQFSSIMACLSDSLFYYFINKSSRFYFFYGERILVSKNGVALFLFDWLSSKDEKV